jgi:hypothetical protein
LEYKVFCGVPSPGSPPACPIRLTGFLRVSLGLERVSRELSDLARDAGEVAKSARRQKLIGTPS